MGLAEEMRFRKGQTESLPVRYRGEKERTGQGEVSEEREREVNPSITHVARSAAHTPGGSPRRPAGNLRDWAARLPRAAVPDISHLSPVLRSRRIWYLYLWDDC